MKLNLNTKIIGKEFMHFYVLDSTNDYAYSLVSNNNPKDGTAILADYQTSGKGQYGRIWDSQPSENILTSVIVRPTFLTVPSIHMLHVFLSISICRLLELYKIKEVHIKWPNDIYVGDAKIAGLLIQNILHADHIKSSILGIGLNVNQSTFNKSIEQKVTSMRLILDRNIRRSILVSKLYKYMDNLYDQLNQGRYKDMLQVYNQYFMANQKYTTVKRGLLVTLDSLQLNGMLLVKNSFGEAIQLMPSQIIKCSEHIN